MQNMKYAILMGDVRGSRELRGEALARCLEVLTIEANGKFAGEVASPLTVTLGDEFQGVLKSEGAATRVILWMERKLLELGPKWELGAIQLRYALNWGEIESPLNRERAHGMLGAGLTRAREMLSEGKRESRYRFNLQDGGKTETLGELFEVLEALRRDWKSQDFDLIRRLLEEEDDTLLGKEFARDRTSIYRRRLSLKTDAYLILETLILKTIKAC